MDSNWEQLTQLIQRQMTQTLMPLQRRSRNWSENPFRYI